ncbi:MAG TPA: chlorite dismutase family protein [Anaerolineales bacterium]|nr:chlorite dismutase family protein [Anaerolineales bacterium]
MDIQRANPESVVDISERGRNQDGSELSLDRRLYMQFLAFGAALDPFHYAKLLDEAGLPGVLYEDLNDPYGIGLLTFSEDPDIFLTRVRSLLRTSPFADLQLKPEYTLLGRTYAIGYEHDLELVLIRRPIERVTDPALPWAVWYPVRRSGSFEQLSADEQRTILMEHGGIGRAYGKAGLVYDIRLACFGLDKWDNDFVIGLLGHELYPLSAIVERMRKTKQTSQYLANLGPFFVGKAIWQSGQAER